MQGFRVYFKIQEKSLKFLICDIPAIHMLTLPSIMSPSPTLALSSTRLAGFSTFLCTELLFPLWSRATVME